MPADPPPLGQTSYSLQHRCTQWSVHSPPHNQPYPCEGCFTLVEMTVVIPYATKVPFTTLHEGDIR